MNVLRYVAAVAFALVVTACQGSSSPVAPPQASSQVDLMRPHWTKTSIGKFADPYGVAVDADGNVYVADPGNKTVLRINPKGAKKTIGDNWPGVTSGKFDPQSVSIGGGEWLVYVADKGTGTVWGVRANNTIAALSGPYPFPHYPRGSAYASGGAASYADVATASPGNTRGSIRCFSKACPVTVREFANPYGVAADDAGTLFVADAGAKEVFRLDSSGVRSIGRFVDPYGVAVTADGATVYVADAGAKKVFQGPADGSAWSEIGTFGDPYGVAVSAQGDVFVADPGTKDVWKLTP